MKTIIIKELGIEVTKPKVWNKPYNRIKIPKGFRLIKVWELWFILDGSKYLHEFLGKFKGIYNWFWCEQTTYGKKYNYASWLCVVRNLSLDSGGQNLASSDKYGRVVFVKEKKE